MSATTTTLRSSRTHNRTWRRHPAREVLPTRRRNLCSLQTETAVKFIWLPLVPWGHSRFCESCADAVAAMDNGCPLCRTPLLWFFVCMISLPFSENLLTIIAWLFNVTYTAILRAFQLPTVLVCFNWRSIPFWNYVQEIVRLSSCYRLCLRY